MSFSSDPVTAPLSSSAKAQAAARQTLAGDRRGWRALLPFLGPAFIASVAYMDPGNFATNIQSGASFGYQLLWVVLFANLSAMLFQALSARLGIVTGQNLPELCRAHFRPSVVYFMWGVSEVAAMATDLAELLGATIALNLLFGLPLLIGLAITALVTYGILLLERRGFRPLEILIGGLVGILALSYICEVAFANPNWKAIAYHSVMPWLGGPDSLVLAVGIVGATVMPHAIYLHSSLTQNRIVPQSPQEAERIVGYSNKEVLLALGLAGLVNMAMMIMAAAVFHNGVNNDVASIETAYHTLTPLLGTGAAAIFLLSLLASGVSSSVVGTMAGQVIMQGFVGFRIPLWVRRTVTMAPAFVIIALGYNTTEALIISQVILSLALPFPMIALLWLITKHQVMGSLKISRPTAILAIVATIVILLLNVLLVLQTLGVKILG